MLGIYLNRRHPGTNRSLWTINDTCSYAEVQAPLFTQAVLRGGRALDSSFDATEYPWTSYDPSQPPEEDPAVYLVRPSATLVVLGGGLRVFGKGESLLPGYPDQWGTVWDGYLHRIERQLRPVSSSRLGRPPRQGNRSEFHPVTQVL